MVRNLFLFLAIGLLPLVSACNDDDSDAEIERLKTQVSRLERAVTRSAPDPVPTPDVEATFESHRRGILAVSGRLDDLRLEFDELADRVNEIEDQDLSDLESDLYTLQSCVEEITAYLAGESGEIRC